MAELNSPPQGDDPLWSELESLGQPKTHPTEASQPPVGVSETARQLDEEGYFDGLAQQFGQERQRRTQETVEDSQGFSETGITGAVKGFFGRSQAAFQEGIARPLSVDREQSWLGSGGALGEAGRLAPEERQQAARSELDTAEFTAPLSRSAADAIPQAPEGGQRTPGLAVPSTILNVTRGLFNANANRQEQRLARAQAMMRGDAEFPEKAEWRSLVDTGARTMADMVASLPIQYAGIIGGYATGNDPADTRLYKFGQQIERNIKQAFPGDPARQFEFTHSLTQGLASTLAFGGQGAVAHLLGAGAKGQLALIGLSGMAAQTPHEFQRVTEAMERGDATERDRIVAVLANSALGATEAAPFANTIAGNARGLRGMVSRGGEQAVEEMAQEALQQGGQNVTRRLTYDPKQDPYEGVLESMVVAAISGFGYGSAFSGGGRQEQSAPVVEARAAGGARPQTEAAPATQVPAQAVPATAEPIVPQPDPVLDPFNLERFAPAPVESADGQIEPEATETPAQEEAAPESDLGRIAAMADRPEDKGEGSSQLPPDVLEYLQQTNPDLAARYGSLERPAGSEAGAVTEPEVQPVSPLRERLESLNRARQEDAARIAEIETVVDRNLPMWQAQLSDVLTRLNVSTPLSNADVRGVARHMASDNLSAEEALERYAVEQYEAERVRRSAPETIGTEARPAAAAPTRGAVGQPAGAPAGGPRDAQLGGVGARPRDSGAVAAVSQPQRGAGQDQAAGSGEQRTLTEPSPDLRRRFRNLLLGKSTIKWAEVPERLRASPEQMDSLLQDAVAQGLLRQNRNGVYRRTAKVAATAELRMPSLETRDSRSLAIPPDVRIDHAIALRVAKTGRPISSSLRSAAVRLAIRSGTPTFDAALREIKGKGLTKPELIDLAHLVGYPPTAKTTKAQAWELIEKRHLDQKAYLERTAKAAKVSQALAAFQSAGAATFLRTKDIPKSADPGISTFTKDTEIKAHADYKAAKGGDAEAAARLVADLVKPENIEEASRRFGSEAIYVPVIAEEASGNNAIPEAIAHYYAGSTGAAMADDIIQISRAYHTGARPMERLIARPAFDGDVVQGGRYVLVDDVSVMGGTLAELAHYIQDNGGEVVGIVTLVNASRGGVYSPTPRQVRQIEERYGDTVREGFGIDPSALTADEATYILNFRDADQLRTSVAKAKGEREQRLLSKGIRSPETGEQGLEGLAAFQRAPQGRPSGSYTPEFISRAPEVVVAIQRELERMVPGDVPIRMVDRLTVGPAEAIERVSIAPDRSILMEVALSHGADTAKLKGFHGVTHVLRESGLWSDQEWALLVERANKVGIPEKLNATHIIYDGRRIPTLEGYRTFYTQQATQTGYSQEQIKATVDELINQELVAGLAESWAEGTSYGAKVDGLLERIAKLFEAIRNALKGLGFQTVDDVFQATVSGEVARRAEGGRREPTFDPVPNKPSPDDVYLSSEEGLEALQVMGAITAFHGSPHDFDRFDLTKIGTGEGAQAFGHGLYFAEKEGTARFYRDVLGKRVNAVAQWPAALQEKYRTEMARLNSELESVYSHTVAMGRQSGVVESGSWDWSRYLEAKTAVDLLFKGPERALTEAERERLPQPRLYEVSLDVEPEQLLDWDKPLSQQSPKIRSAFEKLYADVAKATGYRVPLQPSVAMSEHYQSLSNALRKPISPEMDREAETGWTLFINTVNDRVVDPAAASKALANVGISGIRYLDGGSRSKGDGTYNFVIFDDSLVKIVAKDGKPVTQEERADVLGQTQEGAPDQETAAFAPEPTTRPFNLSVPGQQGTVAEREKATGERLRRYDVKPDIPGTASDTGQSPLQPEQSFIVSEQPDGSWELSFFNAKENIQETVASIEQDIGKRLSPRGWLTPQAYQHYRATDPASVRFHQDAGPLFGGMYASPRAVEFASAAYGEAEGSAADENVAQQVKRLQDLKAALPSEAFAQDDAVRQFTDAGQQAAPSAASLDMSPEARKARAEAMGFDTSRVLHHGTRGSTEPFTQLHASPSGALGPGVYVTPDPEHADGYASPGYFDGTAAVMPLYARLRKSFVWDAANLSDTLQRARQILPSVKGGEGIENSAAFVKALQISGYDALENVGLPIATTKGPVRLHEINVFDPANIRSVNAAFDPAQEGSPLLLAALSDRLRSFVGKPPGQVAPPAAPGGGTAQEVRGLTDMIQELKDALGLTVTQGRYGLTVVDRAGGQRRTFRPSPRLRGQYDREGGIARIRIATDIDAIAHEGGHHLERIFGTELEALKRAHAEELGAAPAPNAPVPALSAIGFSGLEIDAETQDVLVEAVTALRDWRQMLTQRGQSKTRTFGSGVSGATVHEASAKAAKATAILERRLGKPIAQAVIGDILGDARIAPSIVGQSPLRRAVQLANGTSINEIAPEDIAEYVRERYSLGGNPQPRTTPTPSALQLSEGFAEFFRRYITDPDGAQRDIPGVYTAFEEFLDTEHPGLLENLEKLQLTTLSADYNAYRNATALQRLKADTVSEADQRLTTRVKEWLKSIGQADTYSGFASVVYEGGIDENHPHYLLVRQLLEQADQNKIVDQEGRALSLTVHENPYKLMRSVGDAFKTGLRWIQDGMPQYRHTDAGFDVKDASGKVLAFRPTLAGAQAFAATQAGKVTVTSRAGQRSKSLHDALVLAMGEKWEFSKYQAFGSYLIARRGVEEWARYMQGDLERPPLKSYSTGQPADEISALVGIIREYEAANTNFSAAAQSVYDFLWAQAIHDFQAGRLTQPELDYRATRKHFYVPYSRDMRDMTTQRGFGGRTPKFSKDKTFKGSQRSIINPLEAIIDQTFHKAAATHINDVMKSYKALALAVGPGGAEIIEPVTQTQIIEANNAGFRSLEADLVGLGYDPQDAKEMIKRVEADFGDMQLLIKFDPEHLGPVRPLLMTLWENGERTYLRINDPAWAANVYNSLNGIGRELSSLFIDVVAKPATLLRAGVTTSPAFLGPNIIRDMWSAFTLVGNVLSPRTWPGVTQIRGLYHEMAQTDMAKMYQEAAGLMGGQNVAALSKVRDKADIMALKEKGMQIRPVKFVTGATIGGAAGFALAGPVGAGFGALVGSGLHKGPQNFLSTVAHLADMSETATRLGVFTEAYKAALEYNPNLTPYQAAQEAAYVARDLIDFGRRGSKMLAAARLVPFLNANLQGLDKATRTLLARSDRGKAISTTKLTGLMAAGAAAGFAVAGPVGGAAGTFLVPTLATNLAARAAAARALVAPFTKKDFGIPLSRDEEMALASSAKTWANLLLLTLIYVAYSFMYKDDDEYKKIPNRVKVRNQPVKIQGEWFMFPKAFEWAVPGNIIEAAIDSQYGGDPRFWERVGDGLADVLTPPGVPQTARMWRDISANHNSLTGRPIVAENFRADPPELQFNAYASQFAIKLARAVNASPIARGAVEKIGLRVFATPNFELTPAIVDYALSSGLGYWGRDTQKASNITVVGGSRLVDYPLVGTAVQRFLVDPNRANDAVEAYWALMGREHHGYRRAAQGYRRYNEMYGPEGANTYLATLGDPEQQAYALLESSGTTGARRSHPLNRLKGVVEATMDMERDIALERLANTTSRNDPEAIVLSPAKRNEVRDALAAVRAVEANNAMVMLRHRQFAARKIQPVEPALNMLRAASPEALQEYEQRLARKRVADFATVQGWPAERDQLLTQWREAVDEGLALERGQRGRTPRRLPIGTSRSTEESAPVVPQQPPRLDYWGAPAQ